MGLDMYLRGDRFNFSQQRTQKVDGFDVERMVLDLGYWRKFAPLHHYIVSTFAGGSDKCQPIELDADDLNKIAEALEKNQLPANEDCGGFFFGSEDFWNDDRKEAKQHAQTFKAAARWLGQNADNRNLWCNVTYQASW